MDARAGDIVESYAGCPVQDARTLINLVMLHKDDEPATTLRLAVVRGGKKVALDAPPGSLGLKVVDRLLPVREATLVGAGKSHPVKDLLRAELEALKAGELGGYAKRFFCPAGLVVLAPQPGKPIQVLTLADIEGAVEKQYAQVRASLRLDTAKFEKLQLIADGDIALACGKFAVEPKDANAKTIRPPIGLKVHVRLNGKWGMAAGFPGNVAMGLDIQ